MQNYKILLLFCLSLPSTMALAQTTEATKIPNATVGNKPAVGYGANTKNVGQLTPGYGNSISGYGANVSGATITKRCNGRLMSAYDRPCEEQTR